eukprot:jgi/Botrbrau1/13223/Bobra.9_1s0012.1
MASFTLFEVSVTRALHINTCITLATLIAHACLFKLAASHPYIILPDTGESYRTALCTLMYIQNTIPKHCLEQIYKTLLSTLHNHTVLHPRTISGRPDGLSMVFEPAPLPFVIGRLTSNHLE